MPLSAPASLGHVVPFAPMVMSFICSVIPPRRKGAGGLIARIGFLAVPLFFCSQVYRYDQMQRGYNRLLNRQEPVPPFSC